MSKTTPFSGGRAMLLIMRSEVGRRANEIGVQRADNTESIDGVARRTAGTRKCHGSKKLLCWEFVTVRLCGDVCDCVRFLQYYGMFCVDGLFYFQPRIYAHIGAATTLAAGAAQCERLAASGRAEAASTTKVADGRFIHHRAPHTS